MQNSNISAEWGRELMGKKKQGICAYCGKYVARITDDHVIPSCLFAYNPPRMYVKVPACVPCNREKSRDDDYLRDMLVMDITSNGHPVVQEILRRKLARSTSAVAKTIWTNLEFVPAFTESGLYIGMLPSVPLDTNRVDRIFSTIIRGLYYKLYKTRIPDRYTFQTRWLLHNKGIEYAKDLEAIGAQWRCLGADADVFCCLLTHISRDGNTDDKFESNWLLVFYNSIYLTVRVRDPRKSVFSSAMSC